MVQASTSAIGCGEAVPAMALAARQHGVGVRRFRMFLVFDLSIGEGRSELSRQTSVASHTSSGTAQDDQSKVG